MNHTQDHKANDVFAPKGAWQSAEERSEKILDYEPFGSLLPGRNYSSGSYRFGFNGQEKDNEVYGSEGTSYTAEFWQYDTRVARRWDLDPKPNPCISSYSCFALNPLLYGDYEGDTLRYASNQRLLFKLKVSSTMTLMRIFSKSFREVHRQLRNSPRLHEIAEGPNNVMGNFAYPRSLRDHDRSSPSFPNPNPFDPAAEAEAWKQYAADMDSWTSSRPTAHTDGTGDGSIIRLNFKAAKYRHASVTGVSYGSARSLVGHEFAHAGRIDKGTSKGGITVPDTFDLNISFGGGAAQLSISPTFTTMEEQLAVGDQNTMNAEMSSSGLFRNPTRFSYNASEISFSERNGKDAFINK